MQPDDDRVLFNFSKTFFSDVCACVLVSLSL